MLDVAVFTEPKEREWILHRLARELVSPGIRLGPPHGRVNLWINYALMDKSLPGKHIPYFTHFDRQWRDKFFEARDNCDFAILMNNGLFEHLQPIAGRCEVIHPGADLSRKTEILFGVAGRTYKNGRKNERFVANMVDAGYRVTAWGEGWPCRDYKGTRWDFYNRIDYLVVPSTLEGGPMPVLEAIGMGVPVIAPDVGFCWDYPVIRYAKNDWASLNDVLSKLSNRRSWNDWRTDMRALLSRLCAHWDVQ